MSDELTATADTDTSHLVCKEAHSACKITDYEDLSVLMKCWLEQDGEPVRQFYDPTIGGTFKAKVRLDGNLKLHLCATLCLCVHVECIGINDPAETLPCVRLDLNPCGDGIYYFEVYIPPNYLSPGECGNVCCFAATLNSFTICRPPKPGHICCFCKGPCVMVCRPPMH